MRQQIIPLIRVPFFYFELQNPKRNMSKPVAIFCEGMFYLTIKNSQPSDHPILATFYTLLSIQTCVVSEVWFINITNNSVLALCFREFHSVTRKRILHNFTKAWAYTIMLVSVKIKQKNLCGRNCDSMKLTLLPLINEP